MWLFIIANIYHIRMDWKYLFDKVCRNLAKDLAFDFNPHMKMVLSQSIINPL
jgi:hypothetical protein